VKLSSQRIRVVPAYLPTDSTALYTAIATLTTYLECRMGVGNIVPCPEGTLFSPTDKVCVAAYIASPGNSTVAPAGCARQSCACTGRANGIYSDPTGSGQGLMCIYQQPAVMQVGLRVPCARSVAFGAASLNRSCCLSVWWASAP
jgi:hypothetical protein